MKKNLTKQRLLAVAVLLGLAFAGNVLAQDCATPIAIHTDEQNVTGDTCAAGNPLPTYGGTGSPQNEIVYSFVAQGANADISIAGTGGYAGTTPAVFLFPACSAATDPIAFGVPGTPMHVGGLTDGQTYFITATADPGGPNDGCGSYDIDVAGTLPVSLQNFSVE
jgi:hypothetical protein